ncbi:MAG: MBOAT family protein [Verrucomicrobiae bacterium]|nr:MBOAT family protein [Verrucomicrobiae bacterium]
MLFASFSFVLILAVAVPLFYWIRPERRYAVIIVSGVFFYAWNATWWVLLFFSELLISRFYCRGARACWIGIVQAMLVLGIFKYGSFVENNVRAVLGLDPGRTLPVLAVLPLAVSFFTFEFVHFASDFYREKITERNFTKYAAFIFFFPTLVAGPIKRYQDFIPKVEAAVLDWEGISCGITRIFWGFFKKFAIADAMVEWTKFLVPEHIPSLTGIWLWQGVFAYGLRIYFDFSGYADIAIGASLLFGITVPENFSNPYFASNISDFWKRWHISLYRWLVDYIFIPLGGSRCGRWRVCLNIMAVTGFSGFWHGASWNFLIWGWFHGIMLCIFHWYSHWRGEQTEEPPSWWSYSKRIGAILFTYILVNFGWTFFIMDFHSLGIALPKMFFLK